MSETHSSNGITKSVETDSAGMLSAEPRGKDRSRQIFLLAFVPRIVVALLILVFADAINEFSRDAFCYDRDGRFIADDYARGEIAWSKWIDDGWNQFIGLSYYLFGPHMILITIMNAALAAWAAVLTYRIGTSVFQNESVGWLAGAMIALFPSVIYYTSMPLKEAAALFGLLSIVWGIALLMNERKSSGLIWMLAGLAIVAALRFYLVLVCLGCIAVCLVPFQLMPGWKGVFQTGLILVCLAGTALGAVKLSGVDLSQYSALQYFDIDYVNKVRMKLTSHGKARMFEDAESAAYGQSFENDIKNGVTGLFYFFFSIDVTNIRRERQMAALPEMLFLLFCIPYLYHGLVGAWKNAPRRTLPILLFGTVLVMVYGSTATNMGALYRWRVQALPYVFLIIAFGAYCRRKGVLYTLIRRTESRSQTPDTALRAWSPAKVS